jgi:hypothetical protein
MYAFFVDAWQPMELTCAHSLHGRNSTPGPENRFGQKLSTHICIRRSRVGLLACLPWGVPLVPVVLSVSSAIRALSFPRLAGWSSPVETPRKIRLKSLSNPEARRIIFRSHAFFA